MMQQLFISILALKQGIACTCPHPLCCHNWPEPWTSSSRGNRGKEQTGWEAGVRACKGMGARGCIKGQAQLAAPEQNSTVQPSPSTCSLRAAGPLRGGVAALRPARTAGQAGVPRHQMYRNSLCETALAAPRCSSASSRCRSLRCSYRQSSVGSSCLRRVHVWVWMGQR